MEQRNHHLIVNQSRIAGTVTGRVSDLRRRLSRAVAGVPIETLERRQMLSASNITILPTYDSSITKLSDAATIENTIQAAINILESDVTSNSPITVKIKFQDVNSGLGSSNTGQVDIDYSTYLADLKANPNKSATQIAALATMPKGPNTGINDATQVYLTAANLDALGDTADAASALSHHNGFNSIISLNLKVMNHSRPGTDPNKNDLESVAAHEIDEVLGIGGNATTLYQTDASPPASLPTDVSGLDFFRYSAPGVRTFTYDPTATAYFSINGGKSKIVYFNQKNGDGGADFGDWDNPKNDGQGNVPPQVQDAFGGATIKPSEEPNLGVSELTALSVIGYNLISKTTSAPVVTTNPTSQSVVTGKTATFTAAATGAPAPTVQWQVSVKGGAFENIGGATSTTLSVPAVLADSGNQYRAVFTNSVNSATTTPATLTVTFVPTATVSGVVFNDVNGDGVQNNGDANLAGWTVEALQNSTVVASSVSSATGYQITGLAVGTYTIAEVLQAGYTQSAPATTYTVTVTTSGQVISGKDFGDKPSAVTGGIFPTASSIGKPALAGSASFSGGTYTVTGSGRDIFGTSDQFEFDHTNVTGNTTIIANVASITRTEVWAKAGLMIRASEAPDSAFADVVLTADRGVAFQWRATTGGKSYSVDLAGFHAPRRVKLVRSGDVFSAFIQLKDGSWHQIGASQTISLGTHALAGLAVTSIRPNALCTATFTHVSLNGHSV